MLVRKAASFDNCVRPGAAELYGGARPDALGAWWMVHGRTLLTWDQRQKLAMEPEA